MVVFTCSHCGESVQKPKVEKHYETKCRNNLPNLCCMDCLKDFRGDEFKAHTKCVSEAERYGGKGFVAKPNQNKGEKKQNAWIEIVQSVLDENSRLSGALRSLLERVAQQPNTPRKKVKFINFVKSMDHRTPMHDIEAAWDLLSAKLDLLKTCVETKTPNGKSGGDKEEITEEKMECDATQVDSESLVASPGKKHKKNKKDKKANDAKNEEKTNGDLSAETNIECVNGVNDESVVKSLSKKEKKEKRKREKYEAQLKEAALPPNEDEIEEDSVEITKKAKKRKLAQVTEDIANCSIVETNGVPKEKNSEESEPTLKKNKLFDWSSAILAVLESKGKDVALKKLQKAVFNEYCIVSAVSEIPERISKKFTKTLYKIPNVKVINDKVRLVKEEE